MMEKTRTEYNKVSVFRLNGIAVKLAFSINFSYSLFLRKNRKLLITGDVYEEGVLYLIPSPFGSNVKYITGCRLGLFCKTFYKAIKYNSYSIDLVTINGAEALKLLPEALI
jgi:hypothetical protein